jgi:predicted nucleic acid-binding protein
VEILVDTSVWSLALRRRKGLRSEAEDKRIASLWELIQDGRARLIGPIRQELLSGIREAEQFDRIRDQLRGFPDEPLTTEDFEKAAHWSNHCRSRGLVGSGVDFLICAVAISREWQIFTTDSDFGGYARVIPVQLHAA